MKTKMCLVSLPPPFPPSVAFPLYMCVGVYMWFMCTYVSPMGFHVCTWKATEDIPCISLSSSSCSSSFETGSLPEPEAYSFLPMYWLVRNLWGLPFPNFPPETWYCSHVCIYMVLTWLQRIELSVFTFTATTSISTVPNICVWRCLLVSNCSSSHECMSNI